MSKNPTFERVLLEKIRLVKYYGKDEIQTIWHTGLSCAAKEGVGLGIPFSESSNSVVSVILKDEEFLYLYTGKVGSAEIGGKEFMMLEVVDDYLVFEGDMYVRSYDSFSIDPEEEIEKDA